jgi:hypothetical protein
MKYGVSGTGRLFKDITTYADHGLWKPECLHDITGSLTDMYKESAKNDKGLYVMSSHAKTIA